MFSFLSSSRILTGISSLLGILYLLFLTSNNNLPPLDNTLSLIPFSFETPAIIPVSISIFIIIGIFFLVQRINHLHRFSEKSPFVLMFLFLCFISGFWQILMYPNGLIVALLSILAFLPMLNIYNQPSVGSLIFLSSILISLASILFLPSCLLLVTLFISIGIFRPFDLKNIIMVLVAYSLPFFYFFGIAYIFDFHVSLPLENIFHPSEKLNNSYLDDWTRSIPVIGYALIMLLAFFSYFFSKQQLIVRQRNQLNVLFYANLIFTFFTLFYGVEYGFVSLLSSSSFFILLLYNNSKNKWLIESSLTVLFLVSIAHHFLG